MSTAWLTLLLAGLCEVGWALALKSTRGWTRPWPSLATAALIFLSLTLLGRALRVIPLGTAYAVWTGIGATGVALVGVALLGESRDWHRLAFIGLIIAGVVGLRLVSPR